MKICRAVERFTRRSILKSALDLEEELYGLYEALTSELGSEPLPPSLEVVLEEERLHQRLLREIIAGLVPEERIEALMAAPSFHDLSRVSPLDRERYAGILAPLENILARERQVFALYQGLHHKSKIPAVRRSFQFLADQEEVHAKLLERLLEGG